MGYRFPAGQQPPDGPSDLAIVRPAGHEPPPRDTSGPARPGQDLAETDRLRRRRPRGLLPLTRLRIGARRWPRMTRRGVRALVAEQDGAATQPDPARHARRRDRAQHGAAPGWQRAARDVRPAEPDAPA